ncbi:M48 family metalloprotease [Candidatus Palauibacter sp.]|uniref:M48 family metalloprotease n=1 Tax=Candidatus Palauibacter sp. TaxID=3101350 RepID=UPI003B58F121
MMQVRVLALAAALTGAMTVPPETPASTTFSFRIVQDIYPNASALPDGRIYLTTGMLAHVENEAQLAMVLGHEIGHVTEEHALESLRRQRSGQRRNKIIGATAGAALGGLLGGKKGGGAGAVQGAAAGTAAGVLVAAVINSVIRSRYSREQEKAADRIGADLALKRGFDPEQAARFWEMQHERFGRRSLSTRIEHSLFGSHPRDRVRAEGVRELLAGDLKAAIDERRAGDGLSTGTPRFGSVISGLMRDTGAVMAERSDRHDLAIGLLEKARKHRPNDPRLLWALGRTYRMVARSEEKRAEADSLLAMAAAQDKRRIYPAIHRDIAYAVASQSEDYASAAGHLRKYVLGHIGVHGRLPSDIDDAYDKLVLFGDNEWVPPGFGWEAAPQPLQAASAARHHPTVWHTPADLAAYDAALQASTQQIENSFGGPLVDQQADSE